MSSLKSLKLGGVCNALRKLLRKKSSSPSSPAPSPLPAVDSCSGATAPAGGQLADEHASHAHAHADPTHLQQNGKNHDPGLPASSSPPSSPPPAADKPASSSALATTSDGYCNGVSTHEPSGATQDKQVDNMAVATPLGDQKLSQQKAPSQRRVLQDSENKENFPPGEELDASLAGLKLDGTAKEEGESDEQDLSYLDDPVVAAERAEHLRFIGEALDMVSPLRRILQI